MSNCDVSSFLTSNTDFVLPSKENHTQHLSMLTNNAYFTKEDAIASVKLAAKQDLCIMRIRRSNHHTVKLVCDREGVYVPRGKGEREGSSARCGCLFHFPITYVRGAISEWVVGASVGEHNHSLDS